MKVGVKAYIKAIDEKAWHSILIGWSSRTVTTREGTTTKSEETWSKNEDVFALVNFKCYLYFGWC